MRHNCVFAQFQSCQSKPRILIDLANGGILADKCVFAHLRFILGVLVGDYIADLIVEDSVILELKATNSIEMGQSNGETICVDRRLSADEKEASHRWTRMNGMGEKVLL
jgi:hypothetical protein